MSNNSNNINTSNNTHLNDDQRFMINLYLSQYSQINTQINQLYQSLSDIRHNINAVYTQAVNASTQNRTSLRPQPQHQTQQPRQPISSNSRRQNFIYDFYIPLSTTEQTSPSRSQIEAATTTSQYSDIENPLNTECPICLNEFNETTNVTQINHCRHIFDSAELNNWFLTNSRCPVCRFDIRGTTTTNTTSNDLSNNIINNPHTDNIQTMYSLIADLSNNTISSDDLVSLYSSLFGYMN